MLFLAVVPWAQVAGGVGILSLVARMVACNIIVFGSVPCCANVGAGANAGADADADDGDGDGDAFSTSVDGECAMMCLYSMQIPVPSRSMPAFSTNVDGEFAVHVSGFDADTGPVNADADADADAGADADGYFCPSKQPKDRKTIFRRQMSSCQRQL